MRKHPILVLVLIAWAFICNGQPKDLLPGYVLKAGDTLRGYIDFGKDPWNLTELSLWAKRNDKEPQRFAADDLQGFGIPLTDEHFIRRSVKIENTPPNLRPQQKFPEVRLVEKSVFIRVLVKGDLNLYSYHDKKWHFLAGSADYTKELIFIEFLPYGYTETQLYVPYKREIDSLTVDCQKGPKPTLLYREGPIVARVKDYNECKSALQYVRTKGKPHFNITLLFGQASNQVAYTGTSNTGPSTAHLLAASETFSSATTSLFGAALDFSRRKKAKWKFNLELISRGTGEFTASNDETDPLKVRRDYFIEIGYTGLNLGFKTRIVRGNVVQVYLQGNYTRTLSTSLRSYEVLNMQSASPYTFEPMAEFSTSGAGFVAGLQVTYNRLSLMARWETITFTAPASSIQQNAISFLAGVSLFR